jgi:pimeloyl-ACP methyl ester carboxylesterase
VNMSQPPQTISIKKWKDGPIAFIRALGFEEVDLLGFSLGGFVVQDIVRQTPGLVRKVILTGTGPAGGEGIEKVGPVSWPLIIKGMLTLRDPKFYLSFTSTANGRRAAKAFLGRLQERKTDRDKPIRIAVFLRQLKAIKVGARRRHRISARSGSRCWSRMAITISWCPAATRSTWRAACPMPNSFFMRTLGTAASSSITRPS